LGSPGLRGTRPSSLFNLEQALAVGLSPRNPWKTSTGTQLSSYRVKALPSGQFFVTNITLEIGLGHRVGIAPCNLAGSSFEAGGGRHRPENATGAGGRATITRERFSARLGLDGLGAAGPELKTTKGVSREQREAIRRTRDRLRGQPQERQHSADAALAWRKSGTDCPGAGFQIISREADRHPMGRDAASRLSGSARLGERSEESPVRRSRTRYNASFPESVVSTAMP
jgi:hypothetical protein